MRGRLCVDVAVAAAGSLATSTGDGDSIWQSDEEEEHSSSLEEHISSEGREMGEDMRSEGLEA